MVTPIFATIELEAVHMLLVTRIVSSQAIDECLVANEPTGRYKS